MSRLSVLSAIFFVCLQLLFAAADKQVRIATATTFTPDYRQFDANRIRNWFSNVGEISNYSITGNGGMFWPNTTGYLVVFQSGIMLAGIDESGQYNNYRASLVMYDHSFQPGNVAYIDSLSPGTPNDPNSQCFRIYSIRVGDCSDPLSSHYNPDYTAWPVASGAPANDGEYFTDLNLDGVYTYGETYEDFNRNGIYDTPDGVLTEGQDPPLYIGDQTHWYVMNDFYNDDPWDFKDVGVEIQVTTYGFAQKELEDVLFIKWLVVNKSGQQIKKTYFGLFKDPDIGKGSDDYIGCDTLLNLGYCYNGNLTDNDFGIYPPAVGTVLLQGPIIPQSGSQAFAGGRFFTGYVNLPMTAFIYFPYYQWIDEEREYGFYNLLSGKLFDSGPFINPETGAQTKYCYPGDPITGSGWINADSNAPDDVRYILSTGPFDLNTWIDINDNNLAEIGEPGVQEITTAIIIVQGNSNLNAISHLRDLARFTSTYYRYQDNRPHITITSPTADSIYSGTILIKWTNESTYPIAEKIDIEVSTDNGYSWEKIISLSDNPGNYLWNPGDSIDIALGKIRITGYYNPTCSGIGIGSFIYNSPNIDSPPEIFNLQQAYGYTIDISGDFPLQWQIVDPDNTNLSISLQMKNNFQDWQTIFTDLPAKGEWIWPSYLFPNSSDCRLRLCASDINGTTLSEIPHHINLQNERHKLIPLNHVSGKANRIKIQVALVDSSKASSLEHDFEIRFTAGDTITYSIWDLSTNSAVVSDLPIADSLNESPLFEGLAATVYSYPYIRYLPGFSGWTQGYCNWSYDLVNQSGRYFPAEYEIRFTTSGSTDINGTMVPYEVWNVTDNYQPTFLAYKIESDRYVIAVYEEYNGSQKIVWVITLTAPAEGSIAPVAGDICHFYISIPPSSDDIYGFSNRYTKIAKEPVLPDRFVLMPNLPNPFNPSTIIKYQLPEQSMVEITAFNLLGQEVKRLIREQKPAGKYSVVWNAENLPSGIYLIRMTAGNFYKVQKCLLLK